MENYINDRKITREADLKQMKEEITRRNGTDQECICLRRCRAISHCALCREICNNGACLNIVCDNYYISEIVKCDKWCNKWMLSVKSLV